MKKISILVALACATMMAGCAGGKAGKSVRDGVSGASQSKKKSIAEQSVKTKAAMSAYPTKSTPVGADTFLISDSDAANATKKATLSSTKAALGLGTGDNPSFNSVHASGGNLAAANAQVTKKWITGLPYTANVTSVIYGGKHYICTSSHTADSTTEPGVGASWATVWSEVTGGGVSAWSDIQALLTGTGTYVKADGTTGDPTGTITTGAGVAEAMAIALDGIGGLASKASLDALPNIVFGTGIAVAEDTPSADYDTVSIDADTTPTDGSAKPITSNAVFDALAGKQDADADLTTAAGATGAGNSKYFGTNSSGTAGFYDLPSGSGSFVFDTFPQYEDSAHSSGIAVNGTTLAVYSSAAEKWLTVGLTDSLDATPVDTTPDAFTFADVTNAALSTEYTALAQINGIAAGITCSGSGGTVAACTGSTAETCGTFGATSGSITNGQYVGAKVTSSDTASTSTNNVVTCSGVSDTFTANTAEAGSCTTQSVALNQTSTGVSSTGDIYSNGVDAFRFTGTGKKLYSVKFRTSSAAQGASSQWNVYVNTSLDFSGTNIDSFAITTPGTSSTEFSAISDNKPTLSNGTNYYIAIAKIGSAYSDRLNLILNSGTSSTPQYNMWSTFNGLSGTFTQSTTYSLWAEVKECD